MKQERADASKQHRIRSRHTMTDVEKMTDNAAATRGTFRNRSVSDM